MPRYNEQTLDFVANFVDSATIGTFFQDLRRIKRDGHLIRALPRRRFEREFDFDHQTAA